MQENSSNKCYVIFLREGSFQVLSNSTNCFLDRTWGEDTVLARLLFWTDRKLAVLHTGFATCSGFENSWAASIIFFSLSAESPGFSIFERSLVFWLMVNNFHPSLFLFLCFVIFFLVFMSLLTNFCLLQSINQVLECVVCHINYQGQEFWGESLWIFSLLTLLF